MERLLMDKQSHDEEFLLAEYQGLIEIDSSRNERLDRFLTTFITLAAAPWALYALVLKDNGNPGNFGVVPLPVASVFLTIGFIGFLVAMMFVQVRFTIILYTRAMNSIRGHFSARANLGKVFKLPSSGRVPPYYERGGYISIAVAGMGFVNAAYVGFGIYHLSLWPHSSLARTFLSSGFFTAWFLLHIFYYRYQARRRERHDTEAGGLQFVAASRRR
jgi:hypothetical protein